MSAVAEPKSVNDGWPLSITLLGDDIYSCQPLNKRVVEEEMDFIFIAKPRSHKYLYEELPAFKESKQHFAHIPVE